MEHNRGSLHVAICSLMLWIVSAANGQNIEGGCRRLPRPANGRVDYTSELFLGARASRATIHCDPGTALEGRGETICVQGSWILDLNGQCRSGSVRNNVPVTGAPSIQRLPLDEWVTVTAEGCLLFACTVMGSPPPPVAWSVNGGRIDLRSSSDLRQMDDGSLKACNVQPSSHVGTYRCDTRNQQGSAYREIILTANHPVWAELTSTNRQRLSEQNNRDRVENQNVPPPVETNQADRSRDQNVPRGSGPGVQPTIRARPLGQWIGRTRDCCVRIICEVSGEPTPVVTWKRNGRTLNTGSSTGTYSVESSGSLKICTSNHRGHSGTYRCEAANRHGSSYREVSLHASHSVWSEIAKCRQGGNTGTEPEQPPVRVPVFPTREPPQNPGPIEDDTPPTRLPQLPGPQPPRQPVVVDNFEKRPIIAHKDVSEWVEAVSSGCLVFSCSALGSPMPSVSWRINNVPVPALGDYRKMPDGSLEVCNANPRSHSGTYNCTASNMYGRAERIILATAKHPVWASLAGLSQDRIIGATPVDGSAPDIGYSPLEEWVTAGAARCMDLQCRVTGDPPPAITWTFQDNPLELTGSRFELLNDGSLRACEVQSRKYAGRYRCDATNIYGSAWREVAVSQIHPVWEAVEDGYQRPEAPPLDPNAGQPQVPEDTVTAPAPDRGTPEEPAPGPGRGGDGPESRPSIKPIPDVRKWVTMLPNGCMKVWCEVSGNPEASILWRKDQVRIAFNTRLFADYHQLRDGSLRVCNLRPSRHSGTYRCDASNTLGSAYRQVTISEDHPVFESKGGDTDTEEPTTAIVETPAEEVTGQDVTDAAPGPTTTVGNVAGQSPRLLKHHTGGDYLVRLPNGCVKLVCEADGNPQPTITWKRDGMLIDLLFDVDFTPYIDGLRICNFAPENHAGEYECIAENEYGLAERRINVEFAAFTAVPPRDTAPTTVPATTRQQHITSVLDEQATSTTTPSEQATTQPLPQPLTDTGTKTDQVETTEQGVAPTFDPQGIAPTFDSIIDDQLIRISEDGCLYLECDSTGDPAPIMSWRLDNGFIGVDDINMFRILDKGSLKVCNITRQNIDLKLGLYVCDAANHIGSITRTFRVTSEHPVLVEILRRQELTSVTPPTAVTPGTDNDIVYPETTQPGPMLVESPEPPNVVEDILRLRSENSRLQSDLATQRRMMQEAAAQYRVLQRRMSIMESAHQAVNEQLNAANRKLTRAREDLGVCRSREATIRELLTTNSA
eukprot:scpid17906/ scgid33194/ Hemicentin-1; Fibulin-6